MASNQGQSYYKISTAFERQLGAPILPGLATIGRFLLPSSDPAVLSAAKAPPLAPCLAVASSGQKVILHNNNTNTAAAKKSAKRGETGAASGGGSGAVGSPLGGDEAALRTFSFGKEPTAIAAGRLNTAAPVPALWQQEALLFGAATSLLAYNVDQNRQYFYKDVEDGVSAIVSGEVDVVAGDAEGRPVLALVGGNCSVYGFDSQGAERFWTVTGDQVTAMMMLPWDSNTNNNGSGAPPSALVTASEDFEIRVFRGEEAVASIMEVDCVRQLVPLHSSSSSSGGADASYPFPGARPGGDDAGRFAYLLRNGTVGVYQRTERLWRIKSKCLPVSAAFCDVDRDGVAELIIGYDNGRIEIRSDLGAGGGGGSSKGGEVLFRDAYAAPVAAVLTADYRQDGVPLPLVCTVDGNVKGLTLLESRMEEAVETRDTQALEALTQQRALLASQLASLEAQVAMQAAGHSDATMPEAGLEVACAVRANFATQRLDIVFSLRNAPSSGDAVIHSCLLRTSNPVVFSNRDDHNGSAKGDNTASPAAAAGGDDGGALCFFADSPSATLVCAVSYERDFGAEVTASVAVGSAFAESYQVHELTVAVPPFAAYQLPSIAQEHFPGLPLAYTAPTGFVRLTFDQPLRMDVLEAWMRRSFGVPPGVLLADAADPNAATIHVEVVSMRCGGAPLSVEVRGPPAGGAAAARTTITVRGNSMDTCGDVVTSLDAIPGGVTASNSSSPAVGPHRDAVRVPRGAPESAGRPRPRRRPQCHPAQVEHRHGRRGRHCQDAADSRRGRAATGGHGRHAQRLRGPLRRGQGAAR